QVLASMSAPATIRAPRTIDANAAGHGSNASESRATAPDPIKKTPAWGRSSSAEPPLLLPGLLATLIIWQHAPLPRPEPGRPYRPTASTAAFHGTPRQRGGRPRCCGSPAA